MSIPSDPIEFLRVLNNGDIAPVNEGAACALAILIDVLTPEQLHAALSGVMRNQGHGTRFRADTATLTYANTHLNLPEQTYRLTNTANGRAFQPVPG